MQLQVRVWYAIIGHEHDFILFCYDTDTRTFPVATLHYIEKLLNFLSNLLHSLCRCHLSGYANQTSYQ